jgi:hypothetical protein
MAKTRLCERCKAEISAERVEAIPKTRLCPKCSKDTGGDTKLTATDENLAKKESLKKNYGAVTTKVVRKDWRGK